jgi:tRNA pseudouridine55 synthase
MNQNVFLDDPRSLYGPMSSEAPDVQNAQVAIDAIDATDAFAPPRVASRLPLDFDSAPEPTHRPVRIKKQQRRGPVRQSVHGVFLLDKPLGLSSNQALQKVKYLLNAEKAGHTGTLDPLATGVLPICLGAATKFSQLHLEAHKSYWAVARLGELSATGDREGPIEEGGECQHLDLSDSALEALAQRFTGKYLQTPPMHSALKVNGRSLYDYAREGVTLEREGREVELFALKLCEITTPQELLAFDDSLQRPASNPALPHGFVASPEALHKLQPFFKEGKRLLGIKVHCSKGTYIRTLAQDLGEALGCGAYLLSLRRVQTGPFDLTECIRLDALESMAPSQRRDTLLAIDRLLQGHTALHLDDQEAGRFLSGLRRRGPWPDNPQVAVYAQSPPQNLLGTAHVKAGELIAERLLNPQEINSILESFL